MRRIVKQISPCKMVIFLGKIMQILSQRLFANLAVKQNILKLNWKTVGDISMHSMQEKTCNSDITEIEHKIDELICTQHSQVKWNVHMDVDFT